MKIAMFTNTYAPLVGGIEKSVETFADDLRGLGHEVLVVTLQQGEGDRSEPGILRLPALPRFAGGPYAFKLPGAHGLHSAIDGFSPDIIHAHQPFMLGDSAFREAARCRVPLVFTIHTLYERYADRTFLGDLEALERAARKLAVVYANRCDAVIAPTDSIAEILGAQGVEPTIDVVPTGIDTASFASGDGAAFRNRHGIPTEALVAGHLGRLIPAKNVAFLARALADLLVRRPLAWALICGEGQSVPEIREIFSAAGVADRLTLLGIVPPDEIASAYAAMSVFTFASVTDTQGIVLLEAMAAGTPVLALRATGPQDLVVDGHSGRLIDADSTPADFTDALLAMDWPALRSGARQRAGDFDRALCARRLLTVYDRTLERADHRTPGSDLPESVLDSLQRRVETEWQLIAGKAEVLRALLPTRGFPEIPH
jgi:1,2-diacylglycerol 3-alpha-glucosyltransferase